MTPDFVELQGLSFSELEERLENLAIPAIITDENFILIYKNSVFSSRFPNLLCGTSFENEIHNNLRNSLEELTDSEVYWWEIEKDNGFFDMVSFRWRGKYVVLAEPMKNGRNAYLPVSQNTMGILPKSQNRPRSGGFVSTVTATIARELRSNRTSDVFQPSAIIKRILGDIYSFGIPQDRVKFFDYSAETATTGSEREFAFMVCSLLSFSLERGCSNIEITLKNNRGTLSLSVESQGRTRNPNDKKGENNLEKYDSALYTAILAADNNLWDIETEFDENSSKILVTMAEIAAQRNCVLKESLVVFIKMLGKLFFEKSKMNSNSFFSCLKEDK